MKSFFLFIIGIFWGSVAYAATVGVIIDPGFANIGQPVTVTLRLDTQGEDVNAIQGKIIFPASQFTLRAINDGASPVSFWVDRPSEAPSGTVSFSGIIPAGFKGVASSAISLVLRPLA